MLKRFERPLRIACIVLGALVLFQLGRLAFRNNPLDQLKIPPLPTISTNASTQSGTHSTNSVKGMEPKETNSGTSVAGEKKQTNGVANPMSTDKQTNFVTGKMSAGETNPAANTETKNTNSLVVGKTETNTIPAQPRGEKGSNAVSQPNTGTKETNTAALKSGEKKSTNSASLPPGPPRGMGSFPGPGGGKPALNLPPAIQARVDKITQSEILAPIMRPLPMALLGIAGNNAFLRAPSGQSGAVKEGDELGGIKLLKIGTNRVLVEQDGEKKELMVFSGFGGESLLPKEKEQKETPK